MPTYHRYLFCSSSSQLETDVADGDPVSINHAVPECYVEGQINYSFCQALVGIHVPIDYKAIYMYLFKLLVTFQAKPCTTCTNTSKE